VILGFERFLADERPYWRELETLLDRLAADPALPLDLRALRRFHYLYERAGAALARVATFASEPELQRYLESLVSRAYGEIHETRGRPHRLAPWRLLTREFPRAFRRHAGAFRMAVLVLAAGAQFGGGALLFDADARQAILPPFLTDHTPAERVAQEERGVGDRLQGVKTTFSAYLATHNTRVAIASLALGATWGIGTLVLLFVNGVMLGAVAIDYVRAGQTTFLCAWLLPHGSIEIPAFLIAGQAGLVLAGALAGWGDRTPIGARLRRVAPDLGLLMYGVAVLLLWAGFVEAFLSQYHEPVLPYGLKITLGALELLLLALFLVRAGRRDPAAARDAAPPPGGGA
jgi:uncharacterized membrane protein SpoIIM required for sporulation